MQVIHHFVSGFSGIPIDGGDGIEPDEVFFVFEVTAKIDDSRRIDRQCGFSKRLFRFENRGMLDRETLARRSLGGLSCDQSSAPFFQT